MSQRVGSLLYISHIFQAVNAKFNKIRSLGEKILYHLEIIDIVLYHENLKGTNL